jgi:hypothetical protein
MTTSALPVAIVKSEPLFEYQAAHLLISELSRASLERTPVTTYKPEMALQMPSPINWSLRREEADDDGF